ncbi:MAG: glutamate racemase [Chlamydiae bacterium]|nr:glutamate racemase [Chlamydiota bacterium]
MISFFQGKVSWYQKIKPHDPIAIFDSGVGGLTVANALKEILPHEDIIYFADTASRPFGLKSEEELRHILKKNFQNILSYPVKLLVVACHTACTLPLEIPFSIPVLKILPITLKLLKKLPTLSSLLVLGTQRTLQSQLFQKFLQEHFPSTLSYFINASSLEKFIEEPSLDNAKITEEILHLLSPYPLSSLRYLLLACTHFPIYKSLITSLIPSSTQIVDPSIYFARQIQQTLKTRHLLHPPQKRSKELYYTTSDSQAFQKKLFLYFPHIFLRSEITFQQLDNSIIILQDK